MFAICELLLLLLLLCICYLYNLLKWGSYNSIFYIIPSFYSANFNFYFTLYIYIKFPLFSISSILFLLSSNLSISTSLFPFSLYFLHITSHYFRILFPIQYSVTILLTITSLMIFMLFIAADIGDLTICYSELIVVLAVWQ